MTTTCPNGHPSSTSDYCDQCGVRIDGPVAASEAAPGAAAAEPPATAAPPAAVAGVAAAGPALCPVCATPRSGQDRFCEGCGNDFEAGPGTPPRGAPAGPVPGRAAWEAVATADRSYFDRLAADGVTFPPHCPPRTFLLTADQISIGRRSTSRGIDPGIDLSGAPEDTAISHLHALFIRADEGSYAVVDPGSTNGTTVNDNPEPLAANVPVPLADGDRVHIGAWTTLTLHARP